MAYGTQSLVAGAAALLVSSATAHDLPGLVSERNALEPATRTKFDEILQLRRLLAERAAQKSADGQLEAVVQKALRWDSKVIDVCFLDGGLIPKLYVAKTANVWTEGTGIAFDFGSIDKPRVCSAEKPGDIRVSFTGSGYWSYVGTQARSISANKQTLNLQGLDRDAPPYTAYETSAILHEFGHALGFEHEHQSPAEGCDQEFNWTYLYSSMGWSQDEVRRNMMRFDVSSSKTGLVATAFDRKSIMLYSLARAAFNNPDKAKCYIPSANEMLSATDRAAVRYLYPPIGEVVPLPAAAPPGPSIETKDAPDQIAEQRLRQLQRLLKQP